MQISILLAQQIAQLFLILIMGYAVVKAGLLKASDSKVLSVVMVYLVTPCVIINAFQINDTPEIRKGLLYSMAIAAAIHGGECDLQQRGGAGDPAGQGPAGR